MLTQIKIFLISLMMSSGSQTAAAQVDINELSCLTQGVYYEASSEPMEGKIGVANVIVNRTKDPRFPSTICGVIKEKGQFSYRNAPRSINIKNSGIRMQLEESASAATSVMTGETSDNTQGATHFVNAKNANPSWLQRLYSKFKRTVKIANHTFFKPKE